LIKSLFRMAGLEVRRIQNSPVRLPRASMDQGLKWLSQHEFHVETVLDVGASNGMWSEICMSYFPNASYVLFEPQPTHSKALDEFLAARNEKVTLVKKAVGASDGVTYFDATDPFGGVLADAKTNDKIIEVELTTIDSTLANLESVSPYLLKLDTHGFEKGILEGASHTLDNCEVLIIEAYNFQITDEALLFWELCAFLSERGFRPIDMLDVSHREYDNSLWQMDLVFVRSSWSGFKYINYK